MKELLPNAEKVFLEKIGASRASAKKCQTRYCEARRRRTVFSSQRALQDDPRRKPLHATIEDDRLGSQRPKKNGLHTRSERTRSDRAATGSIAVGVHPCRERSPKRSVIMICSLLTVERQLYMYG